LYRPHLSASRLIAANRTGRAQELFTPGHELIRASVRLASSRCSTSSPRRTGPTARRRPMSSARVRYWCGEAPVTHSALPREATRRSADVHRSAAGPRYGGIGSIERSRFLRLVAVEVESDKTVRATTSSMWRQGASGPRSRCTWRTSGAVLDDDEVLGRDPCRSEERDAGFPPPPSPPPPRVRKRIPTRSSRRVSRPTAIDVKPQKVGDALLNYIF